MKKRIKKIRKLIYLRMSKEERLSKRMSRLIKGFKGLSCMYQNKKEVKVSVCYTMRIKGIIDFSSCKDLDNNPVRKYILDIIDYYVVHKGIDEYWPNLDIPLSYIKTGRYLRLFIEQVEKEIKEDAESSWNANYSINANIKDIGNKEKFLIDFMLRETKNKTNTLELFLLLIAEYFNGDIYYSHDEGPDVAPDYEYVVYRHFNNLRELIELKLLSFSNNMAMKAAHGMLKPDDTNIEIKDVFNLSDFDVLAKKYIGDLLDDDNQECSIFGQF